MEKLIIKMGIHVDKFWVSFIFHCAQGLSSSLAWFPIRVGGGWGEQMADTLD